jgi:hypothetical protein
MVSGRAILRKESRRTYSKEVQPENKSKHLLETAFVGEKLSQEEDDDDSTDDGSNYCMHLDYSNFE